MSCDDNRRLSVINGHIAFQARDVSKDEDAQTVAEFKCNCRYPWLRELHGLTAFMMTDDLYVKAFYFLIMFVCAGVSIGTTSYIMNKYNEHQSTTHITIVPTKRLEFPTLTFCPKVPDCIDYEHVYKDVEMHIGFLDSNVTDDLLRFMIGGSGFDNMDVDIFSSEYIRELDNLYGRWRGNRTIVELFRFVFGENGLKCDEFFVSCYAGSQLLDCCEIFEPQYVMLRGRCFRLKPPYYQNDNDETDKLSIYFRNPRSLLVNQTLSRVVLYMGDENPEVSLYPRLYLNENDWNRLRLVQKKISMLPGSNDCSTDPDNQGKGTCFVRSWLKNEVIGTVNCSFPYFYDTLPYVKNIPVCEPKVVVEHYLKLMSTAVENRCQPACERVDNSWTIMNSIDYSPSTNYSFRIEASFNNLEVEHYDEVRTTSVVGFISELGGQSGLFVGCSVITFVQVNTN
ncbi:unnamed protein product [Auanema sp. JU1783]|nr:unnamed protein product [Auanema sp. JU1783]